MPPKLPSACRIALAVLPALAIATTSRAELVQADLYEPGDGLIMVDTESGLQWLHLSQTDGLSWNDIWRGVDNDFRAEGWGWANPDQMCAMFDASGYGYDGCPQASTLPVPDPIPGKIPLVDLLGASDGISVRTGLGLFGPPPGTLGIGYAYYRYRVGVNDSVPFVQFAASISPGQRLPGRGHFLVRPVPSPTSTGLALAALASLAWLRRRPGHGGRHGEGAQRSQGARGPISVHPQLGQPVTESTPDF